MVAALQERSTCELLDCNDAIEALKKEIEVLEAEKTRLSAEVDGLRTTHANVDNLHAQVETLTKQLEGAKAAEVLAVECAQKANEIADNLRKELDAKKELAPRCSNRLAI
jgi:predicted RNase H-like nuclease (RuvC/YqgF family)